MTTTTVFRDTLSEGLVPARGTYSCAANQMIPKGTIVQRNAANRAIVGAAANGFPAVGVANASYNNKTGSENGGLDDSIDIEVCAGVFGFDYTGTPMPGETVWVADNQTVTDTASSNGVAGVCVEIRDGQCFVWMGPHVAALFSDDSALESTVTAVTDELGARVPVLNFNLPAARIYSTGVIAPAFVANTTDGMDPTAESIGFRFNNTSTAALSLSAPIPEDMDPAADMVVHIIGYRVGAADTNAVLTVGAFFRVAGAAFNNDTTAGGSSSAFDGATTVITDETVTLAAANVEAGPGSILLTIAPDATLDTDDLVVLEVYATYTKLTA